MSVILLIFSLLVTIPVLVFCIQIIMAIRPVPGDCQIFSSKETHIVVLIPAHDEESVIRDTIISISDNLPQNSKILVVADNCSDNTAKVVSDLGVEVIERSSDDLRGKGYALDFGISHLRETNAEPEVLLIMDADCIIYDGDIHNFAKACLKLNRPIQGLYLMRNERLASSGQKIAEFAWLVKNFVRPQGFYNMGLPCHLKGTGMAIPWAIIDLANFNSGSIIEDLEIGIEFAINGHPPAYSPKLAIYSNFPTSKEGISSQRKRWEQGHISLILKRTPKLLASGIKSKSFNNIALALDLIVPPLALLALVLSMLTIASLGLLLLNGHSTPLGLSVILLSLFFAAVVLAWVKFGRKIISARDLLYVPIYILRKIPMYLTLLIDREKRWVKTRRDNQ